MENYKLCNAVSISLTRLIKAWYWLKHALHSGRLSQGLSFFKRGVVHWLSTQEEVGTAAAMTVMFTVYKSAGHLYVGR